MPTLPNELIALTGEAALPPELTLAGLVPSVAGTALAEVMLEAGRVAPVAGGVRITADLPDLQLRGVTIEVPSTCDGLTLGWQAAGALQVPGVDWLALEDVGMSLRLAWGELAGRLGGVLRLGGLALPLGVDLPPPESGWVLEPEFERVSVADVAAFAASFGVEDVVSAFPAELTAALDRVAVTGLRMHYQPRGRRFTALAVDLEVDATWEVVPGRILIIKPRLEVAVAEPASPRRVVRKRLAATVQAGSLALPVSVTLDGGEVALAVEADAIPVPNLAAMIDLVGPAVELPVELPALTISNVEVVIDASREPRLTLDVEAELAGSLPGFNYVVMTGFAGSLAVAPGELTGRLAGGLRLGDARLALTVERADAAAKWRFSAAMAEGSPFLKLSDALASLLEGVGLDAELPDFDLKDLSIAATPATGEFNFAAKAASVWSVPLGVTNLEISEIAVKVARAGAGAAKTCALAGELALAGVTVRPTFSIPGGLTFTAEVPTIRPWAAIVGLCGELFADVPVPAQVRELEIGPATLSVDVKRRTLSLRGQASGFAAIELQVRRDAQGKWGAVLALAPAGAVDLEATLGLPGLGDVALADVVVVLSSMRDAGFKFAAAELAGVTGVTQGLRFATKVSPGSLGLSAIAGLPTAPLVMQAQIGRTIGDFELAARLSGPGGRFVLDARSGLALIDPELRLAPAIGEFAVAGRIEATIDAQQLVFAGGFKLAGGRASLFATMIGDWQAPFGLRGVTARDLSVAVTLPGLPSFAGRLQIGRQSGSLKIHPDPVKPVLDLTIGELDLHDLLVSVCEPGLANVPAGMRETITQMRISDAQIYMAPQDTKIGELDCPAGLSVRGTLHVWGLTVAAFVKTGRLGGRLQAEGLVALPDLGGLLVLRGGKDEQGRTRPGPYFKLDLRPGQAPVAVLAAEASVLGGPGAAVDVRLDDTGFALDLDGRLFGAVPAHLTVRGGRFSPTAVYSARVTIDAGYLEEIVVHARAKLTATIDAARAAIEEARGLVTQMEGKLRDLDAAAETRRGQIAAERAAQAAALRAAERELHGKRAELDEVARALAAARATVDDERAEVQRRVDAASRDVGGARGWVRSVDAEINATHQWFYRLPVVDVPWKPSQAREGAWYGLKIAGLHVARGSATAALDVAQAALKAVVDAQQKFPVDSDPRVFGLVAAHAAATGALQAAESAVSTARLGIALVPVEADFRLLAMRTARDAQTLQIVAARAAFDLADGTLSAIKELGAAFAPSVVIEGAEFAGELALLSGGEVRLAVTVRTGAPAVRRTFAVGFDFERPFDCVVELVHRLLGTDSDKALAAVAASTAAATTTTQTAETMALPSGGEVTIRGANGKYLQVGSGIRYGDTISLRVEMWHFLNNNGGGANAVPGDDGPASVRWKLVHPGDPSSTAFINYGDRVAFKSNGGLYLVAEAGQTTVNANRGAIGPWEQWVLEPGGFANPGGRVQVGLPIALRSSHGTYLGAYDQGGQGVYHREGVGQEQKWWVGPNPPSIDVLYAGASAIDERCRFKLQRFGEWIGLLSVATGKYVKVYLDGRVRCDSGSFAFAWAKGEHLGLQGRYLYSEGHGSYLRVAGGVVDADATSLTDPAGQFVVEHHSQVASNLSVGYTAGELAIAALRSGEVVGRSQAGDGPGVEAAAEAAAASKRAEGEATIAAAKQALAQAEADRQARRLRAIERAMRPLPAGMETWRDGALRFEGTGYLEAEALRSAVVKVGDAVNATTEPAVALGAAFTLEVWVFPEAIGERPRTIVCQRTGEASVSLALTVATTGALQVRWAGGSCTSEGVLRLSAWTHVAVTLAGGTMALLFDGAPVYSGAGPAAIPVTTGTWRVGADEGGAGAFIGVIDSLRIWDHARAPALLRGGRHVQSRGDEAGLVACWNLDEPDGDTVFDAGPAGLHLRVKDVVRRARPGGPDGPTIADMPLTLAGGAVQCGTQPLGLGSVLTIEAWIWVERVDGDMAAIVGKWAQGADDELLFAVAADLRLVFGWRTGDAGAYGTPGWDHQFSAGKVVAGRWTHVAAVREGRVIRFFCDGVKIGEGERADELPLRPGGAPLCLGSERGVTRGFTGSLAEVRVWSRARSEAELGATWRRPAAGDEPGLRSLWRLDEGHGAQARDAGPSLRHGSAVGAVSRPARGGPPLVAGATRALRLTGGQYVEFGDDDLFTASIAVTLEAWVQVDAVTAAYTTIVGKWSRDGEAEYLFGLMPSGRLVLLWRTDAEGQAISEVAVTPGRWTHVAVVRAGRSVRFYVDGAAAGASEAADLQAFRNTTAPLRIGGGDPERALRGSVAAVRVWRVARAPADIAAGMRGPVGARTPGRVLDVGFDEGAGAAVIDAASGQLGVLVGSPEFVPVMLPLHATRTVEAAIDGEQTTAALVRALARDIEDAPEAIGAALVRVVDVQRVADVAVGADVSATAAARVVWAALAERSGPSFAALVRHLRVAGMTEAEVEAALVERWGCDASTVARALLRAGPVVVARPDAALLREVWAETSDVSGAYDHATRSEAEARAAGWTREAVRFVALAEAQADTLVVWRETPAASPGSRFRWSTRGAEEAAAEGWQRVAPVCHAYGHRAPGTVPVHLERAGQSWRLALHAEEVSRRLGWTRVGPAFYAYPPDALRPFAEVSLRAVYGHFVGVTSDGAVRAQLRRRGAWERFAVVPLGGPWIALRTTGGRYLRLEADGSLSANGPAIGPAEAFSRQELGCGTIALTASNAKIVAMTDTRELRADQPSLTDGGVFAQVLQPQALAWGISQVSFKQVACAADGAAWAIDAQARVFRRVDGEWRQSDGELHGMIAVGGADHVWGLGLADAIWRWRGDGWERIPGALRHVAVAADGAVWGVNSSGMIYRRVGPYWELIPGTMSRVAVGSATQVYGLDAGDAMWRWTGSAWERVAGSLKELSVLADGTLIGRLASGAVCRRDPGGVWSALEVSLTQVSAGGSELIWGVDPGVGLVCGRAPLVGPQALVDGKHGLQAVAGDVYDGRVYHQAPAGRRNAQWEFTPGSLAGCWTIRDRKHGKCLVAGDVYDGRVYHQDAGGRANAEWRLVATADDPSTFHVVDRKHGKALVAGDAADNHLYHQDPQARANARWRVMPV
ncbi:MAG: RICIN domain-containing protein [Myxococcales bacterium]|nr:RICIN domain-containing protein [Myxococcales bacterium]